MKTLPIYMQDYFGFIYIWYDRARKRFYIGSHMGAYDDGYICSSNSMRDAYKRSPSSFMRRIIYWLPVNDRSKLLEEEMRWLHMISNDELGKKYHNKVRNAMGWIKFSSEDLSRIAKANWEDPKKKKKHIKSMKKAWTPERKAAHAEKLRKRWQDPNGTFQNRTMIVSQEGKARRSKAIIKSNKTRAVSDETREKMSRSAKARGSNR